MVFTSTISSRENDGSLAKVIGAFTNTSGSTGGEVSTGLKSVESITFTHTGAAVVVSAPVANESFPLAGGDVTLVTVADTNGIWTAIGRE